MQRNKKLKKTLPISIVKKDKNYNIVITSTDEEKIKQLLVYL